MNQDYAYARWIWTPELRSFVSIVMAKLEPLRSKIAMVVIVASMGLLVGLITAAIAMD